MICPKCGVNLVQDSKTCPRCGYLFPSDIVDKMAGKVSVDGKLDHYIRQVKEGRPIPKISLLYILFPLNTPYLYKLPFISINTLLLLINLMFGSIVVMRYSGVFGIPYVLLSAGFLAAYYIHNIINFYKVRVENSTIRIMRLERDNEKCGEEKFEELLKNDGKPDIKMFILSFIINSIVLYIVFKFLVLVAH